MSQPIPSGSGLPAGHTKSFNPWPWALVGFFAVAIAATITLVTIAVSNRTELVATDYYDQEMRFQTRLDQIQRAQPFADRIAVKHDAGKGIQVELPAEHAALKATGTVVLYRPSSAGSDLTFQLALDGSGRQLLPEDGVAPGLWKVRLQWRVADQDYFADRKLVIAGGSSRS